MGKVGVGWAKRSVPINIHSDYDGHAALCPSYYLHFIQPTPY
jgi:hypothetical protein